MSNTLRYIRFWHRPHNQWTIKDGDVNITITCRQNLFAALKTYWLSYGEDFDTNIKIKARNEFDFHQVSDAMFEQIEAYDGISVT